MDTTLRDGEQTQGVSFTLPEKANIAKTLLKKLRVDRIEVTSARISDGELGSIQNITSWANDNGFLDSIEVLGFIDKQKSVDWIKESGCKTMNLLTKGSDKTRKAYENDTGKILVSWTDYKLKKKVEDFEKDTERAKGIYSTTGKFALETICRELIKNVKTKEYDTITVFYYHPTPEHLLEWKGGKKTEYEEILGILEDKFKVSINMIPLAFEKDKIDLSEDFS